MKSCELGVNVRYSSLLEAPSVSVLMVVMPLSYVFWLCFAVGYVFL